MNTLNNGNTLFPIFLKLQEFTTLVVGGGPVGLEKVEALLKNDPNASITLVAPDILPELHELSLKHPIRLEQRKFREDDLTGIRLLILATDSRDLHISICRLAHARQILVNVADTPDLCDFYLGSTVKKGDLKIGISTNGKSPTLAKRFREVLEDILPEETNSLLSNLKQIRDQLKGDFAEKVKRLDEITESLRP
jgi:siroheme synthase-like protein